MDEKIKALMLDFKNRLPLDLKGHLKQLIVFGSWARGDAKEDSDLDVIALVDEKNSVIEKELDDIIYQVMWDHDFKPIISFKVFTESRFYNAVKRGFSFYRYVQKEGALI